MGRRGDYQAKHFQFDLLSAAAFANNVPLLESLIEKELRWQGDTFGNPFLVATMARNYEVLSLLFAAGDRKHLLCSSGRIYLLSKVAEKGDIEMVLHILQSGPDFLTEISSVPRKRGRTWPMRQIRCLLYTPSVEIFELMKKELESRKISHLNSPKWTLEILIHAIRWGWVEMTRYLITFGARLDLPQRNAGVTENALYWACREGNDDIVEALFDSGAQICGSEVGIAASNGHTSVVKSLLEKGADVHATASRNSLYGAARKGYMDTTRVLLDAGMDPNTGDTPPLFGAIESEHEGIFRLLVDRGADVAYVSPEARRQAEAAGLESMMALLGEYESQEHTEVLR
ncbi:uncharacterized protein N0V89_003490 [Didymosphaeria variabile]|uniref:Ankyrin n=1 Tax=Didymosphaeria variabile TaxID=1932322 RepID=A0A9W8XN60_9PLEO|nr:uncharacterized protein N0V89_003490 [Didymosphaeria variabile]KAJ4355474.1 hypothetical protein N0V89_003490 [Didymosphaeria variabile]